MPRGSSGPLQEFRNSILVERALVLVAMGMTLWIGIALLVTRPIRRLTAGVEEIGRGNLKARIPSRGDTEVGELARAFNRMAGRLDEAQEERRKAEESRAVLERQYRHAERLAAVGKLASVIAHEVGTPLHVIAGRARNLGRRLPEDDPRQGDVETIREQVGRITRTMQHVLQSSRAIPARREPVDLGRLVRNVAGIVAPEYARTLRPARPVGAGGPPDGSRRRGRAHPGPAEPSHQRPGGDAAPGAAWRSAGRPPRGTAARASRSRSRIPGAGSRLSIWSAIFDPFFSTKRSGGTGLGLSICRDIVRAHEGAITAESAPGAGACFSDLAAAATGGRRSVAEARVLVVDDDAEVVRLLEQDLTAVRFHGPPRVLRGGRSCACCERRRWTRSSPISACRTSTGWRSCAPPPRASRTRR